MIQIEQQIASPFSDAELMAWAEAARLPEATGLVAVRVISAQAMQDFNREYRGKDRSTNVLSFPSELPPELLAELAADDIELGDLLVCAEVVEREALEQGKSPAAHWAHMLVHGMLHLQGYDHINDAEAAEMEALEVKILADLGFANPYEID